MLLGFIIGPLREKYYLKERLIIDKGIYIYLVKLSKEVSYKGF